MYSHRRDQLLLIAVAVSLRCYSACLGHKTQGERARRREAHDEASLVDDRVGALGLALALLLLLLLLGRGLGLLLLLGGLLRLLSLGLGGSLVRRVTVGRESVPTLDAQSACLIERQADDHRSGAAGPSHYSYRTAARAAGKRTSGVGQAEWVAD